MFVAALFTVARRWKQPACPLTDEWVNQMWSVHTVESFSALKRKDVVTHATAEMNLEGTMLSEISQSQKGKPFRVPLV